MAFVFAPLLAEIGGGIGVAASEIFGTTVGSALGGAAVAQANKEINKRLKDAAYNTSVKLFGQEKIDKATDKFNKYSNQAYNTFLYGNPVGKDVLTNRSGRMGNSMMNSDISDKKSTVLIGGLFDLSSLGASTDKVSNSVVVEESDNSEEKDLTHVDMANDVARIVTDHAALLAKDMHPVEAITKVLKKPTDHLIINKLYDHYDKYLPHEDEFLIIQKHVNEKPLNYPLINVHRTSNGILYYSWFDEDLKPHRMMQNLGPTIWPAFPGYYFCGPNSPNNPLRIEDISPLDSLCCLHDESWAKKSFSYEGDLFFIARLHSWLATGKISKNEESLAKKTLIYFSSLGKSVSLLTGSGNNVRRHADINIATGEITSNGGNDVISKTDPLATEEEKSEFFTHFNESIARESNDSLRDMSQELLLEKFLQIKI